MSLGRVVYGRDLVLRLPLVGGSGPVPVVDGVTGLRLVGLVVMVRLDRVFEVVGDGEPVGAAELNAGVRVSFDLDSGLRLWPSAECGAEIVDWLVLEPTGPWVSAPRSVGREVFEGLVDRHTDLVVEDDRLPTLGWRVEPVVSSDLAVGVG